MLLAASRIKPSDEINSVNIRSAPFSLHNALNGGSLTSSIGAKINGKSFNAISPIFTNAKFLAKVINQILIGLMQFLDNTSLTTKLAFFGLLTFLSLVV